MTEIQYELDYWEEGLSDKIDSTDIILVHPDCDGKPFMTLETEMERLKHSLKTEKVFILHYGGLTETLKEIKSEVHTISENKQIPSDCSVYMQFTQLSVAEKMLQKMMDSDLKFDRLYIIMDSRPTERINDSLNTNWGLESEFSAEMVNTFIEQPNPGRDLRYMDIGNWYENAITLGYRGNFRVGVDWDSNTYPFNVIVFIMTFLQYDQWEIHIIAKDEKIKQLMKSAIHFMAEGR